MSIGSYMTIGSYLRTGFHADIGHDTEDVVMFVYITDQDILQDSQRSSVAKRQPPFLIIARCFTGT